MERKRGEGRGKRGFFRKPDRWQRLRSLMRECDVIIEVADARDMYNTRLPKVENWAGKERLLIVANKVDLLSDAAEAGERMKERGFFPLNAKSQDNSDRERLIQAILGKRPMRPLRVFVVGYPNVGKSALINMLAQRKAAQVSSIAGTTKGVQWVRVHPQVLLLDSAGVFPEKLGKTELFFRGAVNVDGLEDPEVYAHAAMMEILDNDIAKNWLQENFDVSLEKGDDAEKAMEKLALRRNLLIKGGEPNVFEASKLLLRSLITAPIMLRGIHLKGVDLPGKESKEEARGRRQERLEEEGGYEGEKRAHGKRARGFKPRH
jgi:ribosome biogenesis GTPase A